jgi:hypothetical protein
LDKKEAEKKIKKETIKDMLAQWKNDREVCSKDAAKK